MQHRAISLALALGLTLASSLCARADTSISLYTGISSTRRSDVRVGQPDGDSLLRAVSWESRSLDPPIYYGLRLARFFGDGAAWGAALDFTHDKVYATGDAEGRLKDVLQGFNMSHGTNYLTLNLVRRFGGPRSKGGLQPYLGAGAGVVIPHVEATVRDRSAEGYQLARGVGLQLSLGASYALFEAWSIFAEYRFTHAHVTVDIPGGDLATTLNTHHFVGGASFVVP